MDTIKCITVKQPWAHLIIHGAKDIENRDWITKYRGPVAIHAGKYVPSTSELLTIGSKFGIDWNKMVLQYGGIIGVAEIVDCVDHSESPWFFGSYGFVLRNARPVKYVAMTGKLGLYNIPLNLIKHVN